MLVLSRKLGERVMVSGPCMVEVVEVRGDKVRLGFWADDCTSIHRQEVAERIPASAPLLGRLLALIAKQQEEIAGLRAAEALAEHGGDLSA